MARSKDQKTVDRKKPWSAPALKYDGELRDFVQGSMKPTDVIGEPGDPGQKPQAA